MPHPGACFWFAMCLAEWCSGRLNCLPKPCMCWQANWSLVICSLVCSNSGCLHSLLKACFFLLSLMKKTRTTDNPSPVCQACVPDMPSCLPTSLIVELSQPCPYGTQMSEVLPEDTMVIADMQALDRGALKSQHQAQDRSTFTRAAKHFDHIHSTCAKWSNSETTAVSLFSWTIPNAFSFLSSSTLLVFWLPGVGGKSIKQKQAFGERFVLLALFLFKMHPSWLYRENVISPCLHKKYEKNTS